MRKTPSGQHPANGRPFLQGNLGFGQQHRTFTDKFRQGCARFHDEAVHGSMDDRQGHKARQIVHNVCL